MDAIPPPTRRSPVSRRPRRPRSADAVGSLTKAFGIWMRSFIPVSLIVLVVNLPAFGFLVLISERTITFKSPKVAALLMMLLMRLLESVAAGAVTYGVIQRLRGRPVGIGASFAMGLRRVLPVIGTGVLTGLVIAIGFVFLFVPGVILTCALAVAIPAAVIERVSGTTAMDRSWKLTNGAKGSIFLAFLLFGLLGAALNLAATFGIGQKSLGAIVLGIALQLVFQGGLSAVFGAVLYHDLRVAKEGASVEDIAQVFD